MGQIINSILYLCSSSRFRGQGGRTQVCTGTSVNTHLRLRQVPSRDRDSLLHVLANTQGKGGLDKRYLANCDPVYEVVPSTVDGIPNLQFVYPAGGDLVGNEWIRVAPVVVVPGNLLSSGTVECHDRLEPARHGVGEIRNKAPGLQAYHQLLADGSLQTNAVGIPRCYLAVEQQRRLHYGRRFAARKPVLAHLPKSSNLETYRVAQPLAGQYPELTVSDRSILVDKDLQEDLLRNLRVWLLLRVEEPGTKAGQFFPTHVVDVPQPRVIGQRGSLLCPGLRHSVGTPSAPYEVAHEPPGLAQ